MYLSKKIFLLLLIVMSATSALVAQNNCIDVNNKIRYSVPYYGGILMRPVSPTTNFIIGAINEPPPNEKGTVILAKTYLDNIVWAKKYYSTERFELPKPFLLPNGNVLFTSFNSIFPYNATLSCISPNGNIVWAKKITSSNANITIGAIYNIDIYNNAVYFTTACQGPLFEIIETITKMDFIGNILWTKGFSNDYSRGSQGGTSLMFQSDTITIINNINYYDNSLFKVDSVALAFTKLNINTGALISSYKLATITDNFFKGISAQQCKMFNNNSISLSGIISAPLTDFPWGIGFSGIPFTATVDKNLKTIQATYFTYNNAISNSFDGQSNFQTQINDNKQTGFLLTDSWDRTGYFVIFDSNAVIKRSRVFRPLSSFIFPLERTFYLDNASTIFYSFDYNPNLNQTDVEYSRISDLAAANTIDCFGRDTVVTIPHSFTMIKDSFLWDNQFENILTATPFTVTEQPFTINQQVICTQTSICDTIKIKGTPQHCTNTTATLTLYKNPQCLRKVNWIVDTTAIKIITPPNDTIINVKFLKNFHGYIKATFDGCVLQDSFYIDVYAAKQKLDLGKDTMLCPGKPSVIDAGAGFKSYLWQDGTTATQTFTASQSGIYSVKAIDSCGNIFNDTVMVNTMNDSLSVNYSPSICSYDTATIFLDPKLKNYSWSPANDGILFSNTLKLFPSTTTLFTVSGERFLNCVFSDTVLIKVINCPVYIYFPNAFTPNNDNRNDYFKPFISGRFEQYELAVYNRFGQVVFATNNMRQGWDGTLKGQPQDPASFIWQCHYKMKGDSAKFIKGSLLLIR